MIWISAGGTGGHIYPAIAIYELLLKQKYLLGLLVKKAWKQRFVMKNIHFHATYNLKWLGFARYLFGYGAYAYL